MSELFWVSVLWLVGLLGVLGGCGWLVGMVLKYCYRYNSGLFGGDGSMRGMELQGGVDHEAEELLGSINRESAILQKVGIYDGERPLI